MAVEDGARGASVQNQLAAAQRGDASAQAELFDKHKHRVARQILRMIGDRSSVDDLVQEVFIAAFAALPGFRGEAQLQSWLHTIALNKVRNWWEARRRRIAREQRGVDGFDERDADPEHGLEVTEHRRRLYEALGKLPDKLREAFVARGVEGLSLLEASELLGVPVSTVSHRTRRAEQALCSELGIQWREEL